MAHSEAGPLTVAMRHLKPGQAPGSAWKTSDVHGVPSRALLALRRSGLRKNASATWALREPGEPGKAFWRFEPRVCKRRGCFSERPGPVKSCTRTRTVRRL